MFFYKDFYVSFIVSLTIQVEIKLPKMAQTVHIWLIDP